MKQAVNVNIEGSLFAMDDEAYVFMKNYLDSIERNFAGVEGAGEILSDIESRIAELLAEADPKRVKVVLPSDVKKIREILGEPSSIAEMKEGDNYTTRAKSSRRLYRDMENRALGGVCSGIAAYLSVDVVWIRILVVVLTLFGIGTGILIYLLLWLVIPPASTISQKLEMRGQEVTISSIAGSARE